MASPAPPSRVAVRWDLPPIAIVRPHPKAYKPIGGDFPFDAPKSWSQVGVNVEYVQAEFFRWQRSLAIISDEALESDRYHAFGDMSLFQVALGALNASVTQENRDDIDRAVRAVLPLLAPWVGAVIRDGIEYDDVFRCAGESLLDLIRNVFALGATKGLTDEQIKQLAKQESILEGRLQHHDALANSGIDALAAAGRAPGAYFWNSLRRHPFRVAGRVVVWAAQPFTVPYRRWRAKRGQPKGVPEHLLPEVH